MIEVGALGQEFLVDGDHVPERFFLSGLVDSGSTISVFPETLLEGLGHFPKVSAESHTLCGRHDFLGTFCKCLGTSFLTPWGYPTPPPRG